MRQKSCCKLAVFIACALSTSMLRADPFDKFRSFLEGRFLDPLAKDLGSVMAGGSFHQGSALGVPGFDVGVHLPIKKASSENVLVSSAATNIALPWVQAEIGLPAKIDLIARAGGGVGGVTLIGGGIRYGIIKGKLPGMPSVSVSALYSALNHDLFEANTISANAVISVKIPVITPYIGVGLDKTKVKPKDAAFSGVGASASRGIEGKASGYRAEAGINLSLFPLTYITLGAGLTNGDAAYHAGLGIKF